MPSTHIVTDSYAHFASPHFTEQHAVTIVPNKIGIGGKTYREGVDLTSDKALRLIAREPYAPVVTPPSVAEYAEVYVRLAQTHDAIISIHASRELSTSWQNAKEAAKQLAGICEIVVIDSGALCAAQAMQVQVAVKAVAQYTALDDVVRVVRGAAERIYSIYYVENIDYLLQNRILTPSHTILGAMLGIKPLLSIEEGQLRAIEKVRTRAQAVERMVEFLVEFVDLEDTIILQNKPNMSEQTRMLQERLALEFPGRSFPYAMYGASFAALVGADASGIVILESEMGLKYDI